MITKTFEDGTFPLSTKSQYEKPAEEEEEKRKADMKEFYKLIAKEEAKGIERTFLKDYFGYKSSTEMLKD